MLQFVLFLCLFMTSLQLQSNFYHEEKCGSKNGFCTLEPECGANYTTVKDGCPMQKNNGAICCTDFPHELVNCHQTHNSCLETCGHGPSLGQRGCPQGQLCCILL